MAKNSFVAEVTFKLARKYLPEINKDKMIELTCGHSPGAFTLWY